MKKEPEAITDKCTVDAVCVQVYAKVVASISHEIKNILAIINENGGLLEDIVLMNEPGQGISSDYVKSATATIFSQIQRANSIIKNCNRFAHFGDRCIAQELLAEILELMTALVQRQADMKNMTVSVECYGDIRIVAPVLPFSSLIYLLLRAIIDASDHNSDVNLSAELSESTITLRFNLSLSLKELSSIIDNDNIKTLVTRLGGLMDIDDGVLQMRLAHKIS